MKPEDKKLSDCLDVISKMYVELLKDIQEYEKVCIYDFNRELAEVYFIKSLKDHHGINTKYIHDGTNGFIKKIK